MGDEVAAAPAPPLPTARDPKVGTLAAAVAKPLLVAPIAGDPPPPNTGAEPNAVDEQKHVTFALYRGCRFTFKDQLTRCPSKGWR